MSKVSPDVYPYKAQEDFLQEKKKETPMFWIDTEKYKCLMHLITISLQGPFCLNK